jgi:hypothetical protein
VHDEIDTPQHWQRRAEEARNLADLSADPADRQAMLMVAATYDTLALKARTNKDPDAS